MRAMNRAFSFLQRLRGRFSERFLAPEDAARVRVFECLFAASFLLWTGRCFVTWREWLTPDGFHLDAAELRSLGYPGPWPLLEPWQVLLLAAAILAGALLAMRLPWRRAGFALLALCALCVQGTDFMAAFSLNKIYVGVFVLLAAAPAMERDPSSGRAVQSLAPLRVLQATLLLHYLAAGLAKVDGDWLGGHDLLWGYLQGVYRTDATAWALRHLPLWAWAVQQHASLGFELLAPLLFAWRRLRPLAFALGLGFHVLIAVLMKDLVFFSLQMLSFYALFVPSPVWRRWAERLAPVLRRGGGGT